MLCSTKPCDLLAICMMSTVGQHNAAFTSWGKRTLQALYSKFLRTLDNFEDAVPELAAFLNNHNEITLQLFLYDVKAARCCSPPVAGVTG